MSTKNNSSAISNEITATAATTTMNKYKVEIADNTGHSTFADLELEAATEKIVASAEQKAHWVYINGQKFEFEGSNHRSKQNIQNLQAQLQAVEDPNILLTGVLRGGCEQVSLLNMS
jgi:hypothetical protein